MFPSTVGWLVALGMIISAGVLGVAKSDRDAATLEGSNAPSMLAEAVPRDATAAFLSSHPGASGDGPPTPSAFDFLGMVVDQAQGMGLMSSVDPGVRGWIDAVTAMPVLFRYPFAVVLVEVETRARRDGGHELAELSAALLMKADGRDEPIQQRIQHLLNTYTNSNHSHLTRSGPDSQSRFTLRDERLPDWLQMEWGKVGELFIFTIGEGTFEKIARTMRDRSASLSDDPWFSRARTQLDDDGSGAWLYFRSAAMTAVDDAALAAKVARVHEALGMGSVQRSLWRFGERDRAVELTAVLHRGQGDTKVTLAGALPSDLERDLIPQTADGYTAIHVRPGGMLRAISQAYLATRSPSAQEKTRLFWSSVEDAAGVSIKDDLLSHLSGPILIHDYPAHPLGLPVALTVTIPIEGDSDALRQNVNRLFGKVEAMIPESSWLQLRKDEDGVWYTSIGLAGPALTVTRQFLVLSYSPQAVRANVQRLAAVSEGIVESLTAEAGRRLDSQNAATATPVNKPE